jgi:ABC-type transporter Mla MlaB component
VAVEALARLQLGARRHGVTVRIVNAPDDLAGLIELFGLADVLAAA